MTSVSDPPPPLFPRLSCIWRGLIHSARRCRRCCCRWRRLEFRTQICSRSWSRFWWPPPTSTFLIESGFWRPTMIRDWWHLELDLLHLRIDQSFSVSVVALCVCQLSSLHVTKTISVQFDSVVYLPIGPNYFSSGIWTRDPRITQTIRRPLCPLCQSCPLMFDLANFRFGNFSKLGCFRYLTEARYTLA